MLELIKVYNASNKPFKKILLCNENRPSWITEIDGKWVTINDERPLITRIDGEWGPHDKDLCRPPFLPSSSPWFVQQWYTCNDNDSIVTRKN